MPQGLPITRIKGSLHTWRLLATKRRPEAQRQQIPPRELCRGKRCFYDAFSVSGRYVLRDPTAGRRTRAWILGGIHVAVGIDRHAFAGHPLQHARLVRMRWNEAGQPVLTVVSGR